MRLKLGSTIERIMAGLGAVALIAIVICLSPLAILWMWLDYPRLQRTALEVAPRQPHEPPPNAIGKVIIFITLPFIVLVGICLSLISAIFAADDPDDRQ
jgi:hypothetical protein